MDLGVILYFSQGASMNNAISSQTSHIDAKEMSDSLGVTLSHLARYVHLSEQSLSRKDRVVKKPVQTRLLDVKSIMSRTRRWFDTDLQAWAWFTGQPLTSLGNLTASEVINLYGDKGVDAIQDYITAKELGGFE